MTVQELLIEARDAGTRGENTAIRKAGRVPGILYGLGKEPSKFSIKELDLVKFLSSGSASKVFYVKFNGESFRVVIKEIQFDPVTDRPIHVDFMRVDKGSRINIKVKIKFLNESMSPAIKKGGVLNTAIHDALLSCDVDNVPESLDVDVSNMDFHNAVKVSDLPLPKGARFIHLLPHLTVATVVAPSGLRSEMNKEADAEAASAATEKDSK